MESDDESAEVMESFEDEKDSKPAASTAFDVAVDYGNDKFFRIIENSGFLLQLEEE